MTGALPLTTRQARLSDAATLAELCTQLGYPTDHKVMAERIDRLLSRPLVHRVVVVPAPEDDRALLGAVHATRRETIESEDHVEITGLIVDERARGTGVGKVLMAAAERWARDLGVKAVRLRSNVVRLEAHAFFERLGYRVLKQQVAFLKEL